MFTIKKILILFLFVFQFVFLVQNSNAIRSYQQCENSTPGRTDSDNFCPRLEGVHLPNCCPPLFKTPAMTCNYVIVRQRGQPVLVDSSYTVCQNGVNVNVACCTVSAINCYDSPVDLSFIPRLIYRIKPSRSQACCVENCPASSYWLQNTSSKVIQGKTITSSHELYTSGAGSQCTGVTLQQCSVGASANCQSSTTCPVPDTPSVPGVGPSPGTGASPGSGSGGPPSGGDSTPSGGGGSADGGTPGGM